MELAFSMMPLWMTAMRPDWSVCGWALGVVGAPCVAQRVWPIPSVPAGICPSICCSRAESFPADFMIFRPFPLTTAIPAESYPRYSIRRRPSMSSPAACRGPMYPTMPHIDRYALT